MKDVRDPAITGRLTMLSEVGKQDIYDAAVRIAGEIGMRVPHAASRDLLVAAGATVDEGDLVHVSREMRRLRSPCTTVTASPPWRSATTAATSAPART